jgi:hypothetical protein
MTDANKPADPKPTADDTTGVAHKITRRRFTKAGAIAPVVMTLGSRPVWGQTCSFSGALSGNDYTTAKPLAGIGHTPMYWLSDEGQQNWPIDGEPNSHQVLDHVDSTYTCVRSFFDANDKFKDVLKDGCSSLQANVAAAILDILDKAYYYEMHGLDAFLCSRIAHGAAGNDEALDVLQCLNGCDLEE